jgi:hypothetical protein
VLEYGSSNAAESAYGAFASSRVPRPTLEATAIKWHEILGHSGPEIIAHFKKAADNVKVTGSASTTIRCETRALTKAY